MTPTGQFFTIGKLGRDMYPERINARGSVTGAYITSDESFGSFFWSMESGLIDLGIGETGELAAMALNDNDLVVGYTRTEAGYEGFRWTLDGGFAPIASLGGNETFPGAVNNDGLVTGYSAVSTKKRNVHAFAWTEAGGTVDLGVLQGGDDSYGQIVTEDGGDRLERGARQAGAHVCVDRSVRHGGTAVARWALRGRRRGERQRCHRGCQLAQGEAGARRRACRDLDPDRAAVK